MSVLEKVDENYVVQWAEDRKFICLKIRTGVKGYPDRLFISPFGHTIFMEFKRSGLKANFREKEKLQAYRIAELQRRGIPAFVVDTRIEAINILKGALEPPSLPNRSGENPSEPGGSGAVPGSRAGENIVQLSSRQHPKEKGPS